MTVVTFFTIVTLVQSVAALTVLVLLMRQCRRVRALRWKLGVMEEVLARAEVLYGEELQKMQGAMLDARAGQHMVMLGDDETMANYLNEVCREMAARKGQA